ncbi:hypothetical protein K488DRAFT_87250 [Vararia minispora EC-137]|uniref:Uncharacterized protein n=1 Tax=Vararia minispora EC-137 TaxID=1314806 RepID=A0ACB8QGR9_9AGAM|nr:hypothetical protein K488DRAFT_87250 [Vararia minispora EC-137]
MSSKRTSSRLQVPQVVVTDADGKPSVSQIRRARSSSSSPKADSRSRASASNPSLVHPADILTFRYMAGGKRGKQVWVDTPDTYEAAVERVIKEFRHELDSVDRRDIALMVGAKLGSTSTGPEAQGNVRIGRTDEAWKRVISTLVRYEIIEVHIDGPNTATVLPEPPTTPPAYTSLASQAPEKSHSGQWAPAAEPLLSARGQKRPKSLSRRVVSWFGP